MAEKVTQPGAEALWAPVEIKPDTCYHWQAGPLQLWVKHAEDEWFLASETLADPDIDVPLKTGTEVAEPEALAWERWIVNSTDNSLRLKPLMPDRPVVARPAVPIHIPPGQTASFFVSIPLWIQITAGKEKPVILCEKPAIVLSNTWFGDPVQGELCYSLNTRARRKLEECAVNPCRALCPVIIRNEHAEALGFERLCIHTDHLSIYEGETQLVTTEVNVAHQGGEKLTRIKYGKKAPALGNIKGKIADPRKAEDSLIRASFSSFVTQAFTG